MMRPVPATAIVLLLHFQLVAQPVLDTTNIELDVLQAPSSPGSVLLGFAENEVERPTDVTRFMLSLRQATGDLSALPNNYAVDLAPALITNSTLSARQLLGLRSIDGKGEKPSYGQQLWQSTVISLAVKGLQPAIAENAEGVDPAAAFGFKFSLVRGTVDSATVNQLDRLEKAMAAYTQALHSNEAANLEKDDLHTDFVAKTTEASVKKNAALDRMEAMQDSLPLLTDATARGLYEFKIAEQRLAAKGFELEQSTYGRMMAQRAAELTDQLKRDKQFMAEEAAAVQQGVEKFKIVRKGFKWDVAGGVALDFVDRRMDLSYVRKAGLWTTLGWETRDHLAFLFLGRYLLNPDGVFMTETDTLAMQDIHNIDLGARLAVDAFDGKFSLSAEAVYRQVQQELGIDPTWRLVATTAYDLGSNRKLSFNFGRQFDGTTSKDGNLIAALNLLFGLGDGPKIDRR